MFAYLKKSFVFLKILLGNFFVVDNIIGYKTSKNANPLMYPKLLGLYYKKNLGKKLNLYFPRSFNEKIQYLKLFDNSKRKTMLSDKLQVLDYVSRFLDNNHLKKIYGVYNSFDEISIESLSFPFYIKTNHGCKMNMKIDSREFWNKNYDSIRNKFELWLKMDYSFVNGFELQYRNIKPKILIEQVIENPDTFCPFDIEIYCFNGKAKLIQIRKIVTEYSFGISLYDENGSYLPYTLNKKHKYQNIDIVPLPQYYKELIRVSKQLSDGFKFVRVDFLCTNSNYYFSELTFTPYSGYYEMPDKKLEDMLSKLLVI